MLLYSMLLFTLLNLETLLSLLAAILGTLESDGRREELWNGAEGTENKWRQ